MSLRNFSFAAVIFLSLGAFALRTYLAESKVAALVPAQSGVFLPEKIERFRVSNTHGAFEVLSRLALENEDFDRTFDTRPWRLGSGIHAALTEPVEKIILALRGIKIPPEAFLSEADDKLSAYGLDAPTVTIELRGAGGSVTLAAGKVNEYTGRRYVLIENRGVAALDTSLFDDLEDLTESSLRDLHPIYFHASDLSEINLEFSDVPLRLKALPDFQWEVVGAGRADPERVRSVIDLLHGVQLVEGDYEEIDTSKQDSLSVSVAKLLFKDGIKRRFVFHDLKNADGLKTAVLTIGDASEGYAVAEEEVRAIFRAEDYRDRKIFRHATDLVTRIEYDFDGKQFVVERSKTGPVLGSRWIAGGVEGDALFIKNVLDALSHLEISQVAETVPGTRFPIEKMIRVTVKDPAKTQILELSVDASPAKNGGVVYARSKNEASIFTIAQLDRKRIFPDPDVFRKVLD